MKRSTGQDSTGQDSTTAGDDAVFVAKRTAAAVDDEVTSTPPITPSPQPTMDPGALKRCVGVCLPRCAHVMSCVACE